MTLLELVDLYNSQPAHQEAIIFTSWKYWQKEFDGLIHKNGPLLNECYSRYYSM